MKGAIAEMRSELPDDIGAPIVRTLHFKVHALIAHAADPVPALEEVSSFIADVIAREIQIEPSGHISRIGDGSLSQRQSSLGWWG